LDLREKVTGGCRVCEKKRFRIGIFHQMLSGLVRSMGEMTNTHKLSSKWNPRRDKSLEKYKRRWKDNTKTYRKEILLMMRTVSVCHTRRGRL
jgi:hypothetical protein